MSSLFFYTFVSRTSASMAMTLTTTNTLIRTFSQAWNHFDLFDFWRLAHCYLPLTSSARTQSEICPKMHLLIDNDNIMWSLERKNTSIWQKRSKSESKRKRRGDQSDAHKCLHKPKIKLWLNECKPTHAEKDSISNITCTKGWSSWLLVLNSLQWFNFHCSAWHSFDFDCNSSRFLSFLMLETEPFDILNYFDLSKENMHQIIVTKSSFERISLLFAIYVCSFVATDCAHFIENIIWGFLSLSLFLCPLLDFIAMKSWFSLKNAL